MTEENLWNGGAEGNRDAASSGVDNEPQETWLLIPDGSRSPIRNDVARESGMMSLGIPK